MKKCIYSIRSSTGIKLGDNCIQNFHLGRDIVGYAVGNLVLRIYIRLYTSPNENFEYCYSHSNALLQFCLKLECCKPHYASCHPTKCDIIDVSYRIWQDILSHIFDVIQSDVALQKQVH